MNGSRFVEVDTDGTDENIQRTNLIGYLVSHLYHLLFHFPSANSNQTKSVSSWLSKSHENDET